MSVALEPRLSALEQAMLELARGQAENQRLVSLLLQEGRELRVVQRRTEEGLDRLAAEMCEFKDEMRAFKNEMREFKDESREDRRSLRREIGQLSNKMGTLAEDIVLPGITTVFKRFFGTDDDADLTARAMRHHPTERGRMKEFDALAATREILLVVETKSKLRPESVPDFIATLAEARSYLPEATGRKMFGALATFYVDPSLVTHGERAGLIMIGLGDGLLEILNTDDSQLRAF